jgi:hypothetical protein
MGDPWFSDVPYTDAGFLGMDRIKCYLGSTATLMDEKTHTCCDGTATMAQLWQFTQKLTVGNDRAHYTPPPIWVGVCCDVVLMRCMWRTLREPGLLHHSMMQPSRDVVEGGGRIHMKPRFMSLSSEDGTSVSCLIPLALCTMREHACADIDSQQLEKARPVHDPSSCLHPLRVVAREYRFFLNGLNIGVTICVV